MCYTLYATQYRVNVYFAFFTSETALIGVGKRRCWGRTSMICEGVGSHILKLKTG